MKKSVRRFAIIPKLKQEISADEERQLETWLRSGQRQSVIEITAVAGKNSGKCKKPYAQYQVWNRTSTVCTPASLSRLENLQKRFELETDIPLRSSSMYSCCHRLLILHRIP